MVLRRQVDVDDVPLEELVDEPVPPPPPSSRTGWVGLRDSVEGVFRTAGAKVFRRDTLTSARPHRRVDS